MHDFIIVGAGSAGCVLANRLSEDRGRSVCLLEAGPPDSHPMIHMPFGIAVMAANRVINWAFETVPQAALNGRRLYWPRGRTLGGSSSINAMIYMRGHREDYADWERATGDPRWGWAAVRERFIRMEANRRLAGDPNHGADGPLEVNDLVHVNALSRAFIEAGTQVQLPRNDDFNGDSQEGVGLFQVTQQRGRRFSAARAFLVPALDRANLSVETGAHVHRILFDGRRATGVSLGDREIRLKPGGEVIVCGGAVNSPQLLMLSGIGPGGDLRRHGIDVVHDLPEVGRNLQDHLDITLLAAASNRLPIGIAPSFLPRALKAGWAYWRRGEGELTTNVAEAGGFARSEPARERPNVQFHFIPALLRDHGRTRSYGYGFTLHVCDLTPKSRGRIALAASDPMAPPAIDPQYLSHPEDLETMLAAAKLGRRIMAAPALAAHTRVELAPGPLVESDDALVDDIRARAETIYHPAGTCRMGRDEASVVDPELRVRGVEGLRVVDASVMPTLLAGNTNAPVMMIADTAADMIPARR